MNTYLQKHVENKSSTNKQAMITTLYRKISSTTAMFWQFNALSLPAETVTPQQTMRIK